MNVSNPRSQRLKEQQLEAQVVKAHIRFTTCLGATALVPEHTELAGIRGGDAFQNPGFVSGVVAKLMERSLLFSQAVSALPPWQLVQEAKPAIKDARHAVVELGETCFDLVHERTFNSSTGRLSSETMVLEKLAQPVHEPKHV